MDVANPYTIGDPMPHVIHKYPISMDPTEYIDISLPEGSKVLHVGDQAGYLTVWVEKTDHPNEQLHRFYTIFTGQTFDRNGGQYVGTVQIGIFVYHVYVGVIYSGY